MTTLVNLSAVYVGVGGYASFRLAQHFLNKRAPVVKGKKIVDDDEQSTEDNQRQTHSQSFEPTATPRKLNSVLPSIFSIQLAVLVAFGAAASHLDLSLEPLLPALAMFTVYRVVLHRFFRKDAPAHVSATSPTKRTSYGLWLAGVQLMVMVALAVSWRFNVSPQAMLSPFFVFSMYKMQTSRPAKETSRPAKEADIDRNGGAGTGAEVGTPAATKAVVHSVLPSPVNVQLAVLVAASAAGFHVGIPSEPMKAAFAMFLWYRIVLKLAPKKAKLKKS